MFSLTKLREKKLSDFNTKLRKFKTNIENKKFPEKNKIRTLNNIKVY